ncbi:sulfurtransferase [Nocardia alba]|uniref:Thiosulfate/3-mercaptopyruvate sulfurtransferase n=1 Tax=Nocardia alba TaxID=225051 RepID=A0A4R1FQ26_9NOCA|nr:rhodanese-like domain-containing protein [Nocardia alba]TCJ96967.1 thiosulfate/3-mercaptopyruvate sulfurtransferase [Nocardia alba]
MGKTVPHAVSVPWLRDHHGEPDLLVVDASVDFTVLEDGTSTLEPGRAAYIAAHVPGAVFADLLTSFADAESEQPCTAPESEHFAIAAGAIGIGDGVRVVVYDQHDGMWATRFWWQLRLEGFDDVAVLDGGLAAWRAAGAEVSNSPVAPTPTVFTARRRPGLIRSTDEVEAAVADDAFRLVGVLDAATYRGETDYFARPGHIPGSINLPVDQIHDPRTGALRPVEELRALFSAAGLLDPAVTPVTYCGGGVAATKVAHALALVGRDDVSVYDGSLTAWAADPALPLVVGEQPG